MQPVSDQIAVALDRGAGEIDVVTRLLHLALVVFGLAAWLTGDLADGYERGVSLGFAIHSWLGIGASAAVGLRLAWGIVGPRSARFSSWLPVTRDRLRLVVEDLHTLLRFRIPERAPHQGLAGVVQSIGLLIFAWVSATGSVLFFTLEPGVRPGPWLDFVKELHEVGETLIPAFLAVHVGATIAHALAGDRGWRIMFFLPSARASRRPLH
ncbi:MAG: cytochrome b/b6 domain-containing protein [Betaproteobacteria bacterium]|nr:cytochrome b/b6 domain-containing protein [Betaproteobacteria bacterium]MDH3437699.1 cytochrome b/b6 domain-containing protein [Betaproteobacteria bacterium]